MVRLNEPLISMRLVEKEMSWEDLAKSCDITSRSLRNIRQYTLGASVRTIVKIANALDLDFRDVLIE